MSRSINHLNIVRSMSKGKILERKLLMEDKLRRFAIVCEENRQEFLEGLTGELLKDGRKPLKELIRRLIPNESKFTSVCKKTLPEVGVAKVLKTIVLELVAKDYKLLRSIPSSFVQLNELLRHHPVQAPTFELYKRLCEIVIEELIYSKDVKDIPGELLYWLLSLLSTSDPSSAGPSNILLRMTNEFLEELKQDSIVDPHLSGQLMGLPDDTRIQIEQDPNATDSKHTQENGGSSHHVEAVVPLLMGLAVDIISRMKQDSNNKEKLDKFWDKTNSNVFMLTAAAAGALYVSKVGKPPPSSSSAPSPDTITAIAVMIGVGFITSFLGCAVAIGDKNLTLVKALTTVGATAAVAMVVTALAAVFAPDNMISTVVIASLFPLLALIYRAFVSLH